MLNPDVAEKTRVNVTVPLLAGIVSLLIARAAPTDASGVPAQVEPPQAARLAA
jgi:hypothetical protein